MRKYFQNLSARSAGSEFRDGDRSARYALRATFPAPRFPIFINDAPHLFAPLRVRDFIEVLLILDDFKAALTHSKKLALYEKLAAVIAALIEPELDVGSITPRALLRLTHAIWRKSLGAPERPLALEPGDRDPTRGPLQKEQLELQVYQLSFLSKEPVAELLDLEVADFNRRLKMWEAVWAKTLLDLRDVIAWPHVSGDSGERIMERFYKKLEALGGGPAPEILEHAEAAEKLL